MSLPRKIYLNNFTKKSFLSEVGKRLSEVLFGPQGLSPKERALYLPLLWGPVLSYAFMRAYRENKRKKEKGESSSYLGDLESTFNQGARIAALTRAFGPVGYFPWIAGEALYREIKSNKPFGEVFKKELGKTFPWFGMMTLGEILATIYAAKKLAGKQTPFKVLMPGLRRFE